MDGRDTSVYEARWLFALPAFWAAAVVGIGLLAG